MPTPQVPLTALQSCLSTPDVTPPSLSLSPDSLQTAPHISLINAAAYVCTCKLKGSVQFSLQLHPEDIKLHAASTESAPPPDLSSIPTDYVTDCTFLFSFIPVFTPNSSRHLKCLRTSITLAS